MAAEPAPDLAARAELKARLSDRTWRLNNLYTIRDKDAREVRFTLNAVQEELDENLHNRNIVLKSRQHGITTYACIRALDTALFRANAQCGLVFHKKEEALKSFGNKILFAYDRLPGWLRAEIPIIKRDMGGEVHFGNGSQIACSTSHRGGTLQFLHVSEYGPMVAMFPLRADEVASGALNALTADGIAIIESTAMGAWGDFYDRSSRAMVHERLVAAGQATRSVLDYRLFFFGWWQDAANRIDPEGVVITPEQHLYFDTLEAQFECRIFPGQRAWYVKKAEEQKDKMLREHPSTPDESFRGSVEGAYYAQEMASIERDGRITDLPFLPNLPVYTFWDIGRSDATAIWVMQQVGPWYHFLRYYESNHQGAAHYANVLTKWRDQYGYRYACHYLPHDAGVADWSQSENKTRAQVIEDMKIGPVQVVERIEVLADGIEMTRQMLARCKFDKTGCGEDPVGSGRGGLPSLRAYRKEFHEKSQTWSDNPIKSWANHGADALRQAAQGFDKAPEQPIDSAAARKRKRQREQRVRSGMAV
jgi:hypothetical protein